MLKGFQKFIVLKELSQTNHSGYSLMKRIEEVSGKKPSPGYIYPLLKELRDNNYVTKKSEGKRDIYSLTKEGKNFLKELQERRNNLMNVFSKLDTNVKKGKDPFLGDDFKKHETQMMRDMDLFMRFQKSRFKLYQKKDFKDKKKKFREIFLKFIKEIEGLAKE